MTELSQQIPGLGWRQILAERKDLLDSYDRAREQARAHEVQTFHGVAGEAFVREWLLKFLPKRFGVTAGYVISTGLPSTEKAPHFDVIVYDQLESPVLWIEDTPDGSDRGHSRAIPVEHVLSVLEVKAAMSDATMQAAVEHLTDLKPLMSGVDAPDARYPLHLPEAFSCGIIFFELRASDAKTDAPLRSLLGGTALRGFFGGVVLRGENHDKPLTGRVQVVQSQTSIESTVGEGKQNLLNALPMSASVEISSNLHLGAILVWSEFAFSQFAFDLIAMMRGTYEPGRVSSFYGLGSSELEGKG